MKTKLTAILCLFSILSFGQTVRSWKPQSDNLQLATLIQSAHIELAPLNLDSILHQDSVEYLNRESVLVPFELDFKENAHRTVLPNGDMIYRLQVSIENSQGLAVSYNKFHLTPGASLHMYTPDKRKVLGAFTNKNNQADSTFITGFVPSNGFVLEYFEPRWSKQKGTIVLGDIYAKYKNGGYISNPNTNHHKVYGFMDSGTCFENANCSTDAASEILKRAAVLVNCFTNSGSYTCSATLMNNSREDGRPLIYFANHCANGGGRFNLYQIVFEYESEGCETPSQDITTAVTVTGTRRLANTSNESSDQLLLEMTNDIPDEVCPIFAGWDARDRNPDGGRLRVYGHPKGDIKKYTIIGGASIRGFGGLFDFRRTHFVGTVTRGGILSGNSGSGAYANNGRIVGAVTGVLNSQPRCGNVTTTIGRLQQSYGTFRPFLDPLGQVNQMDYYDPCETITVNGQAFWDFNKNGTKEASETDISAAKITVLDASNTVLESLEADQQGEYTFNQKVQTPFRVKIELPNAIQGIVPTIQSTNSVTGSHIDTSGVSRLFDLRQNLVQSIIVNGGFVDNQAPSISGVPEDQSLKCGEEPPRFSVEITDNYPTGLVIERDSIITELRSEYTWEAVDVFGNRSEESVVFEQTPAPDFELINVTELNYCQTQQVELSILPTQGQSPYTYIWSSDNGTLGDEGVQIQTLSVPSPGVYQVTATVLDANNCTVTKETSVVFSSDEASATITGETDYCSGGTIELSASGGSEYRWTGPNNFESTSATIQLEDAGTAQSGTYSVMVENESGCTSEAEIDVTVRANQTVDIVVDERVCFGTTFNVSADISPSTGQSLSYNWTIGNQTSTAATPSINTSDFAVGTLNIAVEIIGGDCPISGSTTIEIVDATIANAPNDTSICFGEPFNYNLIDLDEVRWTFPNGSSLNSNAIALSTTSDADAGTYAFTAKNSEGCDVSGAFELGLNSIPSYEKTTDIETCKDQTVTMEVNTEANVTWQGPNGFTSTSKAITISDADVNDSGFYRFELRSAEGCTTTDSVELSVVEQATVEIEGDERICTGEAISLSVPFENAVWTLPNGTRFTGANLVLEDANATQSGLYTVAVESGVCSLTASKRVSVLVTPNYLINEDTESCVGSNLTLRTDLDDAQWIFPSGVRNNNQRIFLEDLRPENAGVYQLSGSKNGCAVEDRFELTIFTISSPTSFQDTTVCRGSTINLDVESSTNTWSLPDGRFVNNNSLALELFDEAMVGEYKVFGEVEGCSYSDSFSIALRNTGTPTIEIEDRDCDGSSIEVGTAQADSYQWFLDGDLVSTDQNPTIATDPQSETVLLRLEVSNESCTDEVSEEVEVLRKPLIDFVVTKETCEGNNGSIEVLNIPEDLFFQWKDLSASQPTRTDLAAGTYTFTIDKEDCIYEYPVEVDFSCEPVIKGISFLDVNRNGLFEEGDQLLRNVPFDVFEGGRLLYQLQTDAQGQYEFVVPVGRTVEIRTTSPIDGLVASRTRSISQERGNHLEANLLIPNLMVEGTAVLQANLGFDDTAAPSFTNLPEADTLFCGETLPEVELEVTDNFYETVAYTVDTVSDETQTVLIFEAEDGSGNIAKDTLIYTKSNNLEVRIEEAQIDLCQGTEVRLNAIADTDKALMYAWTADGGELTDVTMPSPLFTASSAGTYTINLSISDGNCEASSTMELLVSETNSFAIEGDTVLCQGDRLSLRAIGGDQYSWSGPQGFESTMSTIEISSVSSQSSGEYTVEIIKNGCIATLSRNVILERSKPLRISGETSVCQGDTLVVSANSSSHIWVFGNQEVEDLTSLSILPNQIEIGENIVRLVTKSACQDTFSFTFDALGVPDSDLPSDTTLCFGANHTLSSRYESTWFKGDANLGSQLELEAFSPLQVGAYQIAIRDENGCEGFSEIAILGRQCDTMVNRPAADDYDGDGIADVDDLDIDGDGIPDYLEGTTDFDGDGFPNNRDLDADNDGILDWQEALFDTPTGIDEDQDGLRDDFSTFIVLKMDIDADKKLNHLDIDADGDGILDIIEAFGNTGHPKPADNANTDLDSNGVLDVFEFDKAMVNTDMTGLPDMYDTDSDDDGLSDQLEAHDANFDGIIDIDLSQESSQEDADGDGLADIFDMVVGFDAFNSSQSIVDFPSKEGLPAFRQKNEGELLLLFKGQLSQVCTEGAAFTILQGVQVEEQDSCLTFEGRTVGEETIRARRCINEQCDTIQIDLMVLNPTKDTIELSSNRKGNICLDTTQIGQNATLSKLCSDDNIEESNLDGKYCFDFEAGQPGNYELCYALCANGSCDTTIVLLNIEEKLEAIDDFVTINDESTLTIRPLDNDILTDSSNWEVIGELKSGQITQIDNQILYEPSSTSICDVLDSIEYRVFDMQDTSTATIYLEGMCAELGFMNGISSNGDGMNDAFRIENIEHYPNNQLSIYNRNGNLVFEQKGYSNENPWKGGFGEQNLPSGTYYYILETGSTPKYFVGYIQIQ